MRQGLQCSVFWVRWLPFLRWWPLLTRETVRSDLMAGLTGAVIVLPQGVAFATLAGLPPEYGLYTAIVPAVIAALFGSSFHLISGPTTAISIVVFATISPYAAPGSAEFIRLALTLTFIAGAFQLVLGLARMGALVNFISHSVVVGFTAGAAILIATSQLKYFFGVQIPPGESFLHTWLDLIELLPQTNFYVVAVAGATLVTAILFHLLRPRWPVMLFAMIVGSLVAALLGAGSHGIELVGELPQNLPPLSSPDFSVQALRTMAPGALAIAMLGLVEAVSIARSVATRSYQRINGNQEFIGQGLSNIVGSFFSSYASSGSFTRTGVNYSAGAKTPLSALFAAFSLLLILLLVAPLTAHLPIPALAGILLLVAYNLIDMHHIKVIIRTSKAEAAVLFTTFFATLFVELEFAIYAGVMLSLVLYLNRTAKPRIVSLAPDPETDKRKFSADSRLAECPQLKVVRIDGSLFFGAVNHVEETLDALGARQPEQKNLLIMGSGINFVDVAGAEMLVHEAQRRRAMGGALYLVGVKPGVCDAIRKGGHIKEIGPENLFGSKSEAIAEIFESLDHERCTRCDKRIFSECRRFDRAEMPQAASGG